MTLKETLNYVNNKSIANYKGEIWKQHPLYPEYWGSSFGRVKK